MFSGIYDIKYAFYTVELISSHIKGIPATLKCLFNNFKLLICAKQLRFRTTTTAQHHRLCFHPRINNADTVLVRFSAPVHSNFPILFKIF